MSNLVSDCTLRLKVCAPAEEQSALGSCFDKASSAAGQVCFLLFTVLEKRATATGRAGTEAVEIGGILEYKPFFPLIVRKGIIVERVDVATSK